MLTAWSMFGLVLFGGVLQAVGTAAYRIVRDIVAMKAARIDAAISASSAARMSAEQAAEDANKAARIALECEKKLDSVLVSQGLNPSQWRNQS